MPCHARDAIVRAASTIGGIDEVVDYYRALFQRGCIEHGECAGALPPSWTVISKMVSWASLR